MENLLSHGTVKIGTLFDYTQNPKYGEMTKDESEGFFKPRGNIVFWDYRFISEMKIEGTVAPHPDGASTNFSNHTIHSHSNNVYVFSASTVYSVETHRMWLEEEGYDACYVIHSSRLFFRELSRKISNADFVVADKVNYFNEGQKNSVFKHTFHIALLKKAHFDSQKEFRSIWKPKDPDFQISPDVLHCGIGKYCARHKTI